jgi:TolC family type I secretion outer membrane protein
MGVCGLLLSLALAAGAQEKLDLTKAVDVALANNMTLKAASHDVDASGWGKMKAVSNFLPKVDVAAGVTRIDPTTERYANAALDFIKGVGPIFGLPPSVFADIRPFAYRDTYTTQFTVVQPLYNGGAELVGLDAASAARDRSLFAYEEAEQDVIAQVRIAYLNVLKVQELVALSRENAQRIKRYLDMTRRREEAGQRTRTDVLRWEVEYGDAEDKIIRAENGLQLARLQLNEVMGVELGRLFDLERLPVTDTLAAGVTTDPFAGRDSAVVPPTEILDRHPSMGVMRANLDLADAQVSGAWTNFKPRLNVAFQYGWEKNGTAKLDGYRPWALAFTVSYPIFNGFGDYASVRKAQAERERAEAQVTSFRRGLLMQVSGASLALKGTRKRMEVALKARQQAQEVVNSVTRRYETGGASNVDLIDVQTAYTSAQADFITASYDNAIAQIQYARATGTVTR